MIIRFHASIDGEDFTVACVGGRFNVAPTSNPNLGTRKQQNRRAPRHVFTLLLKLHLLPLAPILLRMNCRYNGICLEFAIIYSILIYVSCPCDQATSRPLVLRRLPKSRSAKCRFRFLRIRSNVSVFVTSYNCFI